MYYLIRSIVRAWMWATLWVVLLAALILSAYEGNQHRDNYLRTHATEGK